MTETLRKQVRLGLQESPRRGGGVALASTQRFEALPKSREGLRRGAEPRNIGELNKTSREKNLDTFNVLVYYQTITLNQGSFYGF